MGTNHDDAESCGRCAMTSAVDLAEGRGENPFDGERIEVDEDEIRSVSGHVVALGRLKQRLDEWATRFTYGR